MCKELPGPVAQSVASPTADPGVVSLILSHTFVNITCIHKIISMVILLPVVVSYKPKYVHKVRVNLVVELVQEKLWLGELSIST